MVRLSGARHLRSARGILGAGAIAPTVIAIAIALVAVDIGLGLWMPPRSRRGSRT
ncbi:MAG: hypothetical protein ABFC38_07010 [Methanospirillum sp.]